jgi:hypothetical protein
MTIIGSLEVPNEVTCSIFRKLDHASLRQCSRVCKVFRELAHDENCLKSLFPDVVLPKGITIQQWFLQGIHDRNDLLKCAEHYLSLAAQGKSFFLRISTPLNAELWISTDGTTPVPETRVWCNKDLLPVVPASICIQSENYRLNRGWLRSRCRVSVDFRNTMDENSRLREDIYSIMEKQFSFKIVANNNQLAKGIAGAVGVTALAVLGYFFSKNNE